jgi:hypothetical protein
MLKLVLLVCMSATSFHYLQAQLKRFYQLSEQDTYDTVAFTLKATSGISFIRQADGGNPLHIFGNPDLDHINPTFHSSVVGKTCHAKLVLEEYRKSMVGDGLLFAMMGKKEEEESNYWKFLLNENKVYNLDLNYGIGSSDVDLSGTAVQNVKIRTVVRMWVVNYAKRQPNLVEMDTFMVKVDLGSLEAHDIELSRAKNIIAEIGFGKGLLDFRRPGIKPCNVYATVGAGSLNVVLPTNEPVIIHMKEFTPL